MRHNLVLLLFAIGLISSLVLIGQVQSGSGSNPMAEKLLAESQPTSRPVEAYKPKSVTVRVINEVGELTEPQQSPFVEKSEAEWKAQFDDSEQFKILRKKGTEWAFSGSLLKNQEEGMYVCAGCNLPVYSSKTKFESGTGWPSFYEPIAKENVRLVADKSFGMVRTELICTRCEGHLGHVFNDGPKPTGERHCINSKSLNFVSTANLKSIGEKPMESKSEEIVLGGGCFWCVEAALEQISGVTDVVSGYAGDTAEKANYKDVSYGRTKHAEVVRVQYNAGEIALKEILDLHFASHDPTTLNRQGADVGTQYRSAIFYKNEEQRKFAEDYIAALNRDNTFGKPVVTTIEPLDAFYPAEDYHQDYVKRNPNDPYVRGVAIPKKLKVKKILEAKGELQSE
ncbi:MAG: bifunctional methionine sulfoxide reductase B/A protein [Sumerlaeia bacterium]